MNIKHQDTQAIVRARLQRRDNLNKERAINLLQRGGLENRCAKTIIADNDTPVLNSSLNWTVGHKNERRWNSCEDLLKSVLMFQNSKF